MMRRLLLCLAILAPTFLMAVLTPAPALAGGASYYASPASGSVGVGDVVRVAVMINSGGSAINAGEATVTWSPGLDYSFVSTSGGIFTTWASGGGSGPVGSASSVYFSGGLSNPGYNGGAGRVVTIVFNAKQAGTFHVNINGTQILANDGLGTNVLCCSTGATFNVIPKAPPPPRLTVTSKTHPNESQWYTSHDVSVNWFSTTAVGNYSYSFDKSPTGNPSGPNNATIQTSKTLDDGIWYFHLKGVNDVGSATVNFAIHIDSKPPGGFGVTTDNGGNDSNPTPKANFSASDATSGIARYAASIDGGGPFAINPGDPLPKQSPGDHTLTITAYDKAGNSTSAQAKFHVTGIAPPKILSAPKFLVILKPMTYIGQSEPGDTIFVTMDGQVIDKFIAKDKQVPKAQSKGDGGFPSGITWSYTYNPRLFPGTYHVHFSRINSVGAESEPTKDFPLVIGASEKDHSSTTVTKYKYGLIIFLIALIALQLIGEAITAYLLHYRNWQVHKLRDKTAIAPRDIRILQAIVHWTPFGFAARSLENEQGSLFLGALKRRKQRRDDEPAPPGPPDG